MTKSSPTLVAILVEKIYLKWVTSNDKNTINCIISALAPIKFMLLFLAVCSMNEFIYSLQLSIPAVHSSLMSVFTFLSNWIKSGKNKIICVVIWKLFWLILIMVVFRLTFKLKSVRWWWTIVGVHYNLSSPVQKLKYNEDKN